MTRVLPGLIAAAGAIVLTAAPAAAQSADSFVARLQRLDELHRRAVLRNALVTSGQPCRRVELAEPRGRLRNLAMWTARCAPAGDYGLFIGPDGSVQVRTCADLATLRLPPCRLPPRAPTPAPRKK